MYHFFRFENDKYSCLDLRKLHWAAITFYCHFRQCHFRSSMSWRQIEGQVKVKSIIMKDNFMILQLKWNYSLIQIVISLFEQLLHLPWQDKIQNELNMILRNHGWLFDSTRAAE